MRRKELEKLVRHNHRRADERYWELYHKIELILDHLGVKIQAEHTKLVKKEGGRK